jgi:hypothetical protein
MKAFLEGPGWVAGWVWHQFFGFWGFTRTLYGVGHLLRLNHKDLFWDFRGIGRTLCSLGPFSGAGHLSLLWVFIHQFESADVDLKTRPPLKTWFYPCPRFSCSTNGPTLVAFGAAAPHFWLSSVGVRFAGAAFTSFHLVQPDNWLC